MIPKFRAWDYDEKRMHDVLVIDWLNRLVDLDFGNIEKPFRSVELMQSTRLKDMNGVEIFEGDIVDWLGKEGVVSFELNDQQTMISTKSDDYITVLDYTTHFNTQVIGNIYENKEQKEVSP